LEGFRVRRTKSQVVVVSIEVQCFRQVRCVVATLLFGRHNLSKIFVQNKAEKKPTKFSGNVVQETFILYKQYIRKKKTEKKHGRLT
jgi:tRNA U38,U39,U40 pseudouridine synthase TruA